jgi:hypothetical protein
MADEMVDSGDDLACAMACLCRGDLLPTLLPVVQTSESASATPAYVYMYSCNVGTLTYMCILADIHIHASQQLTYACNVCMLTYIYIFTYADKHIHTYMYMHVHIT